MQRIISLGRFRSLGSWERLPPITAMKWNNRIAQAFRPGYTGSSIRPERAAELSEDFVRPFHGEERFVSGVRAKLLPLARQSVELL
jgi:hypothetical protein